MNAKNTAIVVVLAMAGTIAMSAPALAAGRGGWGTPPGGWDVVMEGRGLASQGWILTNNSGDPGFDGLLRTWGDNWDSDDVTTFTVVGSGETEDGVTTAANAIVLQLQDNYAASDNGHGRRLKFAKPFVGTYDTNPDNTTRNPERNLINSKGGVTIIMRFRVVPGTLYEPESTMGEQCYRADIVGGDASDGDDDRFGLGVGYSTARWCSGDDTLSTNIAVGDLTASFRTFWMVFEPHPGGNLDNWKGTLYVDGHTSPIARAMFGPGDMGPDGVWTTPPENSDQNATENWFKGGDEVFTEAGANNYPEYRGKAFAYFGPGRTGATVTIQYDYVCWKAGAYYPIRSLKLAEQILDDDAMAPSAGDGDGYAEPGETVELWANLANTGVLNLNDLAGTFSLVSGTSVTLLNGHLTWPTIRAGETRSSSMGVVLAVAPSCLPGTPIRLHGIVDDSDPAFGPWTIDLATDVAAVSSVSGTVRDANTHLPIANVAVRAGHPVVVFRDDMESGKTKWAAGLPWDLTTTSSHSPVTCWTDSPGGNYANNASVSLYSVPFSLVGLTDSRLRFWQRYDIQFGGDLCYVLASSDGITYSTRSIFSGQVLSWYEATVDLRPYDGLPAVIVGFRLTSDSSLTADGWYIDDVTVEGTGYLQSQTNAGGAYQIDGLSSASWTVSPDAAGRGYSASSPTVRLLSVPPDRSGVDFELLSPEINLRPTAFTFTVAQARVSTKTLGISTTGTAQLAWSVTNDVWGAAASGGGPDSFGYRWTDSDHAGGPACQWVEINAAGTDMSLTDESRFWPISLPFNFRFYGVDHNQVAVSSNGAIYFQNATLGWTNAAIPSANSAGIAAFLAPYWDDLNPSSTAGKVYYQIQGTAPNRVLVVEWDSVLSYGTGNRVTFEALLYERSGRIVFQYKDVGSAPGGTATVGIQGSATVGLQYSYNAASLHDGLAIEFYCGVSWLSHTPQSGTLPVGSATSVTLRADAWGLRTGTERAVLRVRANDVDEPVTTIPVTLIVTPDLTPPTAPGVPVPDRTPYTSQSTVAYSWSAAGDPDTWIDSYHCQVGTTPGGHNILDLLVGDVLTTAVRGSNGQTLYCRVRAVNGGGTPGAWSGNSAPTLIDLAGPPAPRAPTCSTLFTSMTTVRFSWTATTDPGAAHSGVASYDLQVGTGPGWSNVFSGNVGAALTWQATGWHEQRLYARVCARDRAGNIGSWSPSSAGVLIDMVAPTAPGTPTDAGAFTSSTSVRFNWTAAADPGTAPSGVASYDLQVGTGPGLSNVFNGNVGNVLTRQVSGSHGQQLHARVRAHDRAGNVGPWSSNSDGITIDTARPRLASLTVLNQGILQVTFNEPVFNADKAVNYTCTRGLAVVGVTPVSETQYRFYTASQTPGTSYTLTVGGGVKDRAGNSMDPAYRSRAFTGGAKTEAGPWHLYR